MAAPRCPTSRSLLALARAIRANGAAVVTPTDKLVYKRLKRYGLVTLKKERYPRMRLTLHGEHCIRKLK